MADLINLEKILNKYPLVSDQVNTAQLRVILQELEKTLQKGVEGDIVEFGCYIGTTSLFIRRLLDLHRQTQTFHVYDSFEGLPEKSARDTSGAGEQFKAGTLRVSKKQLLHEFQKAHLMPPVIHKGWFGKLGAAEVPKQIAFAFLDGDFYESIKDSLMLVLPRMSPGGTIIVDDYAREALPGVAKAVHELLPTYIAVQNKYNLGVVHL